MCVWVWGGGWVRGGGGCECGWVMVRGRVCTGPLAVAAWTHLLQLQLLNLVDVDVHAA